MPTSNWIATTDRLPPSRDRVLACWQNAGLQGVAWITPEGHWVCQGMSCIGFAPSHWMPLPDRPLAEDAELRSIFDLTGMLLDVMRASGLSPHQQAAAGWSAIWQAGECSEAPIEDRISLIDSFIGSIMPRAKESWSACVGRREFRAALNAVIHEPGWGVVARLEYAFLGAFVAHRAYAVARVFGAVARRLQGIHEHAHRRLTKRVAFALSGPCFEASYLFHQLLALAMQRRSILMNRRITALENQKLVANRVKG